MIAEIRLCGGFYIYKRVNFAVFNIADSSIDRYHTVGIFHIV